MSVGTALIEFFKKPWYYRVINRSNRLGATVEAESCIEAQINSLASTTWQVTDPEAYGLLQDIVLPGKRIAPMVNAQGVAAPRLTYQVLYTDANPTKRGPSSLDTIDIRIACHAKEYEQAERILSEVRVLFERYEGTLAGVRVQSVNFVNQLDLYSENADLVGVSQEYSVRIERNGGN